MRHQSLTRTLAVITVGVLAASFLTACGDDDDDDTASAGVETTVGDETTTTGGEETAGVDLSADCPATIVIQDSWWPLAEIGFLYELLGDDYAVDNGKKSVTGALMSGGVDTGVKIELRSGGPAVGFQSPQSLLYTDDSITIASVGLDFVLQTVEDFPVKGVFVHVTKSPLIIMWDPETYPDVTTIEELSPQLEENGGVVYYSADTAYMAYLQQKGILSEGVVDGSYDGSPANFVAGGGKNAQQGYASFEPFVYENEIDDWGRPLTYELVADTGWDFEASFMAIRPEDEQTLGACMEKLVPVFQQGVIDYFGDPSAAKERMLDVIAQYDGGHVYTAATMDYANETLPELGLVGNGSNDTIGDFDPDRLDQFLEVAKPVFDELGTPIPEDFEMTDIYTNDYIDESLGL